MTANGDCEHALIVSKTYYKDLLLLNLDVVEKRCCDTDLLLKLFAANFIGSSES